MYKIQNVVLKLNLINLNFLLLDHVIIFLHISRFSFEFHVLVLIDLILLSIYQRRNKNVCYSKPTKIFEQWILIRFSNWEDNSDRLFFSLYAVILISIPKINVDKDMWHVDQTPFWSHSDTKIHFGSFNWIKSDVIDRHI